MPPGRLARVTFQRAILNLAIWDKNPVTIYEHFDASRRCSVPGWATITSIAATGAVTVG